MTESRPVTSTTTSRVIRASATALYNAFVDPAALVEWLPPGTMTGRMHTFDLRVGGGYRMSLFYAPDDAPRGKTSDREDMVDVRFVELTPPRRIVEAVRFVSADSALGNEMTLTITLDSAPDGTAVTQGTQVTLRFDNLPPGVRPEDNDEGARQSLEQLARRFE